MRDPEVIVVGAGPAGSAAAAELARRGVRTLLVDRARFPRDKPCGDYCDPGAVRLLEGMGLLPALLAQGAAVIGGMTVVAQTGSAFSTAFPTGRALLVPRRRLDALLADHAAQAGAEIIEGYQVDHVAIDGGAVVGDLHRGTDLRAHLLIAADGMRSAVARRLGLLRGLPAGRYTVGAYFSGVPGAAAGELHLGDRLYGGVARFGDGTANVCLAMPRQFFRRRGAEAAFAEGVRTLPLLRESLRSWQRETSFRVTGPVGFTSHPILHAHTLLAGDAAAQIEPLTGQGIYFALQSGTLAAVAGAAALQSGNLTPAALAGYARRRARLLGRKLRVMKVVAAIALRPRLAPRLVGRLAAEPPLAQMLLGVTGDVLPPASVSSVRYLARLLLGPYAHDS